MKCSIIIPVYNVEKYLEKCVNSVLCQSEKNYEIILIDDGSTDKSGYICDVYVEKYPDTIKCIHQSNSGQSHARNVGIEAAKGDYILFVDSDDYLENETFLEDILPRVETPDIIAFSWKQVPDGDSDSIISPDQSLSSLNGFYANGAEYLKDALKSNYSYTWYPWKYLIRMEHWKSKGFRYIEGSTYEDVELLYKVLLAANGIQVRSEVVGYCYRTQRKGSTVYQPNTKIYMDMINVANSNIVSIQEATNIDDELKVLLCNNFSYIFYAVMMNLGFIKDKTELKKLRSMLHLHKDLCKYTIDRKYLPIKIFMSIFGVVNTSWLLGIRTRLKYGVR